MQRNTKTILEQLRIGDRFYKHGDQKKRVYEVLAKPLFKTIVIDPSLLEQYRERNSKKISNQTAVVFIRHTVPVPGEECFIEDLVEDDVFHKIGLLAPKYLTKYKILSTGNLFYNVAPVNDTLLIEKAGRLATVIFVKHKDN